MAFQIRGSHIAAVLIAGGVIGWMATGEVVVGGQAGSPNAVPPPAERSAEEQTLFKVRYVPVTEEARSEILNVRGRTQADSIVSVRAETAGTVEKRLVNKGQRVNAGDLVCQLDKGIRESAVREAEAALAQVQFDYDANLQLKDKGFATDTRLNALKAQRDGASARLDQAKQELGRADVYATTGGVVQDPLVEVGDQLGIGGVCVTLIETNPMLFIGQVSERQIAQIKLGDDADITLVSGENVTGQVRYIASSADPQTRTFGVEIELPNEDFKLRDGVTASAQIVLDATPAYRLSPSWLTLDDDGKIGVRVVGDNDVVEFVELKILGQTDQGMWVSGLTSGTRVISLGQDYVAAGQKVEPFADTAFLETLKSGERS